MDQTKRTNRRTVLKTLGTGIVGGALLTGTATAQGTHDNSYGDGNGIGVFLNEEAEFKEHPIWTGEIADRRRESVVDVAVGAMTTVDAPEGPPQLPFGFAPQVINVSPGATVRWRWVSNPFGFPVPHNVVSLVDANGDPVLEHDGDPSYESELIGYKSSPDADEPPEEDLPTFEVTFTDRGDHLYYCRPHGAPYEVHGHYNLVGMRGAVKVSGRQL